MTSLPTIERSMVIISYPHPVPYLLKTYLINLLLSIDVLNRKVKGEDRDVGRARSKAINDRKVKLLSDYLSTKKSNQFQDKRFGENDTNMTLGALLYYNYSCS